MIIDVNNYPYQAYLTKIMMKIKSGYYYMALWALIVILIILLIIYRDKY